MQLPDSTSSDLMLLAQFHDIGKVGISDHILYKPGPLTPEEMEEIKLHSIIGYRIAVSSPDLASIAELILKHHEWYNGMGYPLGLKGQDIPLECRILLIADAYDAMTNDRPYRKAMPHNEALRELEKCSGQQFDPVLVKQFINLVQPKSF
jgi:HD-GYP domain-containing protein (c-di-GMP phosphodiesterase class II)